MTKTIEIAKIVGTANSKSWSQVHSFRPVDEKLKSHGQLVAALAFEAKKEIEVTSFGTEIITRLQEIYYSNESKSILKKILQTMESLAAEFIETVSLEIVMAVVWSFESAQGEETILYAGRNEGGQVFLERDEKLVPLLTEKPGELLAVSGKLAAGDRMLIGTPQFFRIVPEGTIKVALTSGTAGQAGESLAPLVHGHGENSQAAGAVIKLADDDRQEEGGGEQREEGGEKVEKRKINQAGSEAMVKLRDKAATLVKKLKRRFKVGGRPVYVRPEMGRRRRSAATIVIVLLLVLAVSLVLAGKKRQTSRREKEYQQVMEEAGYKYREAKNLIELNPLRAKSLLKEAKEKVREYKEGEQAKSGVGQAELDELERGIEEVLALVQREYQVEEAKEWFDFDLVKQGFRGSDWDVEGSQALVGGVPAAVVKLNLETKAAELVAAGEEVAGGKWVGLGGERGFVAGDKKVVVLDVEEKEVVTKMETDWQKAIDVVGFSSNLYVLDAAADGQIWKYLGVKSGLSNKKTYLKGERFDLSEAVDMAIDGSVWVLFSDGTIVKYTQGVKDAFVTVGLDQPYGEAIKIYTDGDQDNLYILDHKNTRVVVLNKNGEYQAQYVWSGIAGVKDLIVKEDLGKIFLLTGEKIFTIELKD